MTFPKVKIVSDGHPSCGTKVYYQHSADEAPVDISGVVQRVDWTHNAGELPTASLVVVMPCLDSQTAAVKTAIEYIDPRDPITNGGTWRDEATEDGTAQGGGGHREDERGGEEAQGPADGQ